MALVHSQCYGTDTYIKFQNIFITPKETKYLLSAQSPLSSLEWEMATHSSIPAWRIPWTVKPGELQSMGSQRVGHDWVTEHACMHPTQVNAWKQPICFLSLWMYFSGYSCKWNHTIYDLLYSGFFCLVHLTLEQHELELDGSSHAHMFFNKFIP